MKKQKAHLALAASVLCAVQMGYVQAAGQTGMFGTTVPTEYQTDINNELASYPGELRDSQAYDTSTIRVVRRDSEVKKITAEGLPTRVDADYMRYKGNTGDIDASGDVVVTQGTKELRAPRVTGNVNTQEYNTAGGPYKFLEDGGKSKNMSGDSLAYQAATQSIQSTNVTGFSDPYYFKANNVDFKNNVGHIDKGMVTTKHAMAWKHTPDYRIEGEDIVVYPNDKAVIKHPTFYIKNTKILSLPSYTASLRHDKEGKFSAFSLLPRPKMTLITVLAYMLIWLYRLVVMGNGTLIISSFLRWDLSLILATVASFLGGKLPLVTLRMMQLFAMKKCG